MHEGKSNNVVYVGINPVNAQFFVLLPDGATNRFPGTLAGAGELCKFIGSRNDITFEIDAGCKHPDFFPQFQAGAIELVNELRGHM